MSLTFGFTSKKRPTVVYMNYKFNQYSKNNKGCIHWRCVEYVRFKCRAKLVTFENKMLENSAPLHTHPANKSDVAQKCANDAHEQQACDSFQVKAIEKQDKLIKHYSVLSSPSNSNGTNAEENENELQALYNTNAEENENDLQALYNTLSPADNYNDLAETSDEEFGSPEIHQQSKKAKKVNSFSGSIKIAQHNLNHVQVNRWLSKLSQLHRKLCFVLKTFSVGSVKIAN